MADLISDKSGQRMKEYEETTRIANLISRLKAKNENKEGKNTEEKEEKREEKKEKHEDEAYNREKNLDKEAEKRLKDARAGGNIPSENVGALAFLNMLALAAHLI